MTDVGSLLSAYLDNELDTDERAAVESALASSEDLRADLASLRATRALLRSLPDVEPKRPLPRQRPGPPVRTGLRARRLGATVVAVAAAWLVVLSIGVSVGRLPLVPDVDELMIAHAAAVDGPPPGFTPMPADDAANDPAVMESIGHGMDLTTHGQRGDLVLSQYSDGVHAVSVFHQPGSVDWDSMPAGGEMKKMDGETAWEFSAGGTQVVVTQRGDLIVTVVADGALEKSMAPMVASMVPEVHVDQSLWSRLWDAPGNLLDRF